MIHVAIFDANLQDREELSKVVTSFMEVQKEHYKLTVFDTLEAICNYPYPLHIILLDTESEDMDGIKLGKFLLEKHPNPKIIYVTHEAEKCNHAINIAHAFAYLNKPLVTEQLNYQLKSACEYLKKPSLSIPDASILTFSVLPKEKEPRKANTYPMDFYIPDIHYFEYENRMIKCICTDGEYLLFREKLCHIIEQTKDHYFTYCHKGYIVNLASIASIQRSQILLKNGMYLPLAQRRSSQVRRQHKEYLYRNKRLKNRSFSASQ